MESQEKNESDRKSSRNSSKIYYVSDSDCDESQAKHDAFLAESGSDFEEEIKRGKRSKFQASDSDSEVENQVSRKKKKKEILPKTPSKTPAKTPAKTPPKLVANPFFGKKVDNKKKQESGPTENIAFMDYEDSGNETGSRIETGSGDVLADTSHPKIATKFASIFEKTKKQAQNAHNVLFIYLKRN